MKDKIVYLAHNLKNAKILRAATSVIADKNPRLCFVNPRIMFSHLNGEEYMESALTLLDMCDEMWIVGDGAKCEHYETEYCREYKIPIKTVRR